MARFFLNGYGERFKRAAASHTCVMKLNETETKSHALKLKACSKKQM